MGSGTTGVAAVREGCQYIGFDMDADWVEKAKERIAAETPAVVEVAAAIDEEDWLG